MIDQITLLKRTWKTGAAILAVIALVFAGLFWSLGATWASYEDWEDSRGEESCEDCGGNVSVNTNTNTNTNENKNKQVQKQENNQTVEITQNVTQTTAAPAVAAAVPTKQPETGSGVLGLALSLGAAPLGLLMARFGRRRKIGAREEKSLSEIAYDLVEQRVEGK